LAFFQGGQREEKSLGTQGTFCYRAGQGELVPSTSLDGRKGKKTQVELPRPEEREMEKKEKVLASLGLTAGERE